MKKFKKFDLDNPQETSEYEDLLNNPDRYTIIKENFTWDKLKNNKPFIAVWYEILDEM